MFGIDDLIGGLIGGGLKMLANKQQNVFAQQQAATQQAYTQQNVAEAERFNAAEAEKARDFSVSQQREMQDYNTQMMLESQAYNAQQADIARQFSAQQQTQAEGFNASQAELNRQFQQQMSSTAYQRAMADMRAAGLNPLLAYQQGGASTPGGSSASVGAVGGASASSGAASSSALGGPSASIGALPGGRPGDPRALLEGVTTSAAELMRLEPTIKNIRADTGVKDEHAINLTSQTDANRAVIARTRAETRTENERTENVRQDTENKRREQARVAGVNPEWWFDKLRGISGDSSPTPVFDFSKNPSMTDFLSRFGSSAKSVYQSIFGGD